MGRFGKFILLAASIVTAFMILGLNPRRLAVAGPPTTCEQNGYCYLTPAGAGLKNGVDWNNAYADLPSSLTRGVRYFLAGSASTYGAKKLNTADSTTTRIYIYKAVSCVTVPTAPYCTGQPDAIPAGYQPQAVAGWNSAFGTLQAEWFAGLASTPAGGVAGIVSTLNVCTDYWTIDGVTGVTDPASGGPSGQGFWVYGPSQHGIVGSNNSCAATVYGHVNNVTVKHVEISSYRSLRVAVNTCTDNGDGTYTITTPDPSWKTLWPSNPWASGDEVAGFDSASQILWRHSSQNTHVQTPSGDTFTVTPSPAMNACTNLSTVALDNGRFNLIQAMTAPGTVTFDGWDIEYNYLHDAQGNIFTVDSWSNSTIARNYFARNSSTPSMHSSPIVFSCTNSTCASNSFYYNWIVDGQGTGYISNLGYSGETNSNFAIFGNAFFYTDAEATAANAVGAMIRCINGTVCTNWQIFNNTIYNFLNSGAAINCGDSGHDCSTGTLFVYDNLFVKSHSVGPLVTGSSTISYTAGETANIVQDYNYYDTNNTGTTSSDVHGAAANINVANFFTSATSGNFNLRTHTPNFLNTSTILPANSTDANGSARGTGGSWDAGAFQFTGTGAPPNPPANLTVTGVH